MEKLSQIILPPVSHFSGVVRVPGSKSISNRVLLLAALAEGESNFEGLLESDDTRYMREALNVVGNEFFSFVKNIGKAAQNGDVEDRDDKNKVCGNTNPIELFLGNAGTAMRSLTAALCLGESGEYILNGEPRMRERPIKDLVDALRKLGADITYLENDGYPPLKIKPCGLNGGEVSIKGNISSQFLTALLIAAPYCKTPLTINIVGELISKPYIYMTIKLMEKFGAKVENENGEYKKFQISNGKYKGQILEIEGDASSASYFFAGNAITAGCADDGGVEVEGIPQNSLQGDMMFAEELKSHFGLPKETSSAPSALAQDKLRVAVLNEGLVIIDATLFPDAAMTLCPVAMYANGKTKITGIASWKVKETDRISAMAAELRKFGAVVEAGDDFIEITPPEKFPEKVTVETYNDHRMAMCFSLLSLNSPNKKGAEVTILDPACVNKTYPNYFDEFKRLRGE